MVKNKALPSGLRAAGAMLLATTFLLNAETAIAEGGVAAPPQGQDDKPLRRVVLEVSIEMVETDLSSVERDISAREKELVSVSEKLGVKAPTPFCEKLKISPQAPRQYYNISSVYNVSASVRFGIDSPEIAYRLLANLLKRGYAATLNVEVVFPHDGLNPADIHAPASRCG